MKNPIITITISIGDGSDVVKVLEGGPTENFHPPTTPTPTPYTPTPGIQTLNPELYKQFMEVDLPAAKPTATASWTGWSDSALLTLENTGGRYDEVEQWNPQCGGGNKESRCRDMVAEIVHKPGTFPRIDVVQYWVCGMDGAWANVSPNTDQLCALVEPFRTDLSPDAMHTYIRANFKNWSHNRIRNALIRVYWHEE
jgi:hypothetical protein